MKIQNSNLKDLDDSLAAIELALEVLQQPLAVYDCSDAELQRSIEQFKMMRVAYLLLKRNAVNTRYAIKAPHPFKCGCKECMPSPKDSLSIWTDSQYEASGQ